jgi:phosphatidylserine/phosphatidylglycerophosphate/cardiolipin synthase-like enzyme
MLCETRAMRYRFVMMKKDIYQAVVAVAIALAAFAGFEAGIFYYHASFTVLYSLDKKQNDQAIIGVIDDADTYVYFAVYTFTKENIADALIAAKQRGLDVRGITDATQAQLPAEVTLLKRLEKAGIPVETQKHADGIMHIKAVVTDKAYALGSYNWTSSATLVNDELLEIGTDQYLHDQYVAIIKKVLTINE